MTTSHRRKEVLLGLGWLLTFGIAATAGGSCKVDDPDHCRHSLGDSACPDSAPYCDKCGTSEKDGGCVVQEPDDGCYFPGDDPFGGDSDSTVGGSGSSTGDEGSATSTTSGPGAECTAPGERDDACPPDAPYCVDGACVPCGDGGGDGDALCAAADDALPICGEFGECLACAPGDDSLCSGQTEFCDDNGACSGCFRHDQCGMAGCDLYTGECLSETLVYWVTSPTCPGGKGGFGDESSPYCNLSSIQSNIDGLPSDADVRVTVRIVGGGDIDGSLTVNGEGAALVVLGDGSQPRIGADEAFRTYLGGHLYTQGVDLRGTSSPTVRCNSGAKVWLRDTDVVNNPGDVGIEALAGCEFTIERGIVGGNQDGGISGENSDFTLLSTAVINNGDTATDTGGIHLVGGSLTARHVTIVANDRSDAGHNLSCADGATVDMRNSVVMRENGLSFGGCDLMDLRSSVIDDKPLADSIEAVKHAAFQADYFFSISASNPRLPSGTPFTDVAV
ncbi:MAG: hypothetical protein JKY37_18315 [Nannocystaceae bacterium]|nr:hypothetical protein [Nannocystaceae bacterium]